MMTSKTHRIVAAACALGLAAAGLTACGSNDTPKKEADSVEKQLDNAGDAAVNGSSESTEKESTDTSKAEKADKDAGKAADDAAKDVVDAVKDDAEKAKDDIENGDMTAVTDAAGAEVTIPLQIPAEAQSIGEATIGKLMNVKHTGDKWVASYSNGWHIAYSPDTGPAPVKGKIGQVWFDGGNITNPIGLPLGPEQVKANDMWVQTFTNGEIWAKADGTFGVEKK